MSQDKIEKYDLSLSGMLFWETGATKRQQKDINCNIIRNNRQGGNFFKIVFVPFWKLVYSKREEFAPHGSRFFPFRIDLFSGGT